jgi:hypothetical protein
VSADPQPYATFVVELLLAEGGGVRRTRVTHVQTRAEDQWRSWDGERLLEFIVANTGAPDTG